MAKSRKKGRKPVQKQQQYVAAPKVQLKVLDGVTINGMSFAVPTGARNRKDNHVNREGKAKRQFDSFNDVLEFLYSIEDAETINVESPFCCSVCSKWHIG